MPLTATQVDHTDNPVWNVTDTRHPTRWWAVARIDTDTPLIVSASGRYLKPTSATGARVLTAAREHHAHTTLGGGCS